MQHSLFLPYFTYLINLFWKISRSLRLLLKEFHSFCLRYQFYCTIFLITTKSCVNIHNLLRKVVKHFDHPKITPASHLTKEIEAGGKFINDQVEALPVFFRSFKPFYITCLRALKLLYFFFCHFLAPNCRSQAC